MNEIVQNIGNAISSSLGAPLAVFLLAMIPIAEARGAILCGVSMQLSPGEAFLYAFLGSSLTAPILLLVLIPIINALSKTRFFSKIGKFLYDKFEKKSRSLKADIEDSSENAESGDAPKKKFLTRSDLKKMGGTAIFVAIPLPLTGVWTGSAVASICKIGFVRGLIGVIVGNAAACGIMTLLAFLFKDYIDYITIGFFALALIIVIILIIKLILYKPKEAEGAADGAEASQTVNADSDTDIKE